MLSSVHSVSFVRCFVWSPRLPVGGLGSGVVEVPDASSHAGRRLLHDFHNVWF